LKLSASSRVENNLAIILYSTELRIPTDVSCICFLTKVLLETQARAIQLTANRINLPYASELYLAFNISPLFSSTSALL